MGVWGVFIYGLWYSQDTDMGHNEFMNPGVSVSPRFVISFIFLSVTPCFHFFMLVIKSFNTLGRSTGGKKEVLATLILISNGHASYFPGGRE